MRILVTGANGFVGDAVVRAVIRQGHKVDALVRPTSSHSFDDLERNEDLTLVRLDIRDVSGMSTALIGVDAVIHLAAAKAGDFHTQFATTVVGTEALLEAMSNAGVRRLVAVSSFSVYDFEQIPSESALTETSPIVGRTSRRDDYSSTKRIQEDLCRGYSGNGTEVVVVRPGMIYGPFELWHALLGSHVGPLFWRIGRNARLPMIFVDNAADAMVLAASVPGAADETFNLVDNAPPTQDQYVKIVTKHITPPKHFVVPWKVMNAATKALSVTNNILWGGQAKFPGILVWSKLQARFKPLTYPNSRAKALLGWEPAVGLEDAIKLSVLRENQANQANQANHANHAGHPTSTL